MPGPPPPPPPGPPPPPSMAAFKASSSAPSGDGRNQLLQSIRQGAKLKKAVTVDKSAPMIQGKTTETSSGGAAPTRAGGAGQTSQNGGGGGMMALGGLFAGGMPKLKPTGRGIVRNENVAETNTKSANKPLPAKQLTSSGPSLPSNKLEHNNNNNVGKTSQSPPVSLLRSNSKSHTETHVSKPGKVSKITTERRISIEGNPDRKPNNNNNNHTVYTGGSISRPSPIQQQHSLDKPKSSTLRSVHNKTTPHRQNTTTVNQSHIAQLLNKTLAAGVAGFSNTEQQQQQQQSLKKAHGGVQPPSRAPPPQPPPPQPPTKLQLNQAQHQQDTLTSPTIIQRINSISNQDTDAMAPPPPMPNINTLQRNPSRLHGTTASLQKQTSTQESNRIDPVNRLSDPQQASKGINHGKPNIAPKPPGVYIPPVNSNGAQQQQQPPSPKVLNANGRPVSRAQSFKVTRSPPATPLCPPTDGITSHTFTNNGFHTLRPSKVSQMQDGLNRKPLPMLPKNSAPPPPPPLGPKVQNRPPLRPPMHGPPPPPRPTDQPPPPPPHRHPAPVSDSSHGPGPPQPPVRGSSMRTAEKDLESRFLDRFHPINHFPCPDAFLRTEKTYASASATIQSSNMNMNKQQAPPPPPIMHLQLGNKMYANNSSAC